MPLWLAIMMGVPAMVLMLRWLLTIRTQTVSLDEVVWNFWLPVLLSSLPVWLWLRPRLRVLTFTKKRERRRFIFFLVPVAAILATLIFAQQYLVEATARITPVKTADEIFTAPYSRYYRIENFSVDRNFNGLFSASAIESGGRYSFIRSRKEVHTLYWTVPFQLPDSVSTNLTIWYGIKRSNTLTGEISATERKYSADRFYQYSIREMQNYNYHGAQYLKRLPASDERTSFLNSVQQRISPVGDHIIILVPVTGGIDARTGDSLAWAIGWFIVGIISFLLLLTWPEFSEVGFKRFQSGKR